MHKSKSSSKGKARARWGDWSEWIWEENQRFYYRVRQDADGNLDYDYGQPSDGDANDEKTPKYTDPVDEITAGVERLSSPRSGTYEDEYVVTSGSGSSRKDHDRHGKAKDTQSRYTSAENHKTSERRGQDRNTGYEPPQEESESYHGYEGGRGTAYTSANAYSSGSTPRQGDRAQAYGSAYAEDAYDLQDDMGAYSYGTDEYAGSSSAYAAAYEPIDEGGRRTPRASHSRSHPHITATVDTAETLDTRYRIEHSDRFQPGEIFKASWAEPKGSVNEAPASVSGHQEMLDKFGTAFYTGFRRFIVIANDHGHCTCVPILTYGGKACTKRGVKPEKHGIIYQRGQKARLLDREPKLGFPPVKVDITMEGEKLSKDSRVNYSKLVTVEHNVKVMFIGTITTSDWPIVPDAINACWAQKTHHKKKNMFR